MGPAVPFCATCLWLSAKHVELAALGTPDCVLGCRAGGPSGLASNRTPAAGEKQTTAAHSSASARLLPVVNLASGEPCYGGPMSTPPCAEIRTRLETTEANVEWMRRKFRSLPADHPDGGVCDWSADPRTGTAGAGAA
jgi:hypothetical protein